jgi:hypothetical protein
MGRAIAVVLLSAIGLHAAELDLDPRTVLEAVSLGQSSLEGDRSRFHRPYRFQVSRPPLDAIDVVTPFRRVVIAAEVRALAGDRRFGQRDGLAVAAQYPRQVSVHAEFTFHPQNTFVLVPRYTVRWLTAAGARIEPASTDWSPRYFQKTGPASLPVPPAVAGVVPPSLPGRSQPMLGATVVAFFDGALLQKPEDPARELVIEEAGQHLARLPIDLTRLR